MREENAVILDYLARGYASSFKKEPIAQALGEQFLSLLELVPKEDTTLELKEKVYIGPDKRDKIQYIKGRIFYSNLTATARSELQSVVEDLVSKDEKRFVDFFNKTGPLSVRRHSLEMLPNIGKKHMWDILAEREKKPFESFDDISKRIKLMPDPKRVVVERILEELRGDSKYLMFVKAMPKPVSRGVSHRYRP